MVNIYFTRVIALIAFVKVINGLSLNLCSTVNLGTSHSSSNYMSNGKCHDTCLNSGYSYAIVQSYDCWCSNDAPQNTVSLSYCNATCPGFGYEHCASEGYYGYIQLSSVGQTEGSNTISSTTTSETDDKSSSETQSTTSTKEDSTTPSKTESSTANNDITTSQSTRITLVTQTVEVTQTYKESQTTRIRTTIYYRYTVSPSTSQISSSSTSSTSSSSTSSISSTSSTSSTSNTPSTTIEPSTTSKGSSKTSNSATSSSASISSDPIPSDVSTSSSIRATTIYSVKTINGTPTQLVRTQYITTTPNSSLTTSSTTHESETSVANASQNKNFFDSKGKVAGTFTAVGIVVTGLILGILYCCCCGRSTSDNDDGFTDEENQYSSDEISVGNEKAMAASFPISTKVPSSTGTISSLKRENSSKSILSIFNLSNHTGGGLARSSSKKKLNPNGPSGSNSTGNIDNINGGLMFPISELDSRLDPATMFLNNNESIKSLGDDVDYSRKILKITNPE